MKSKVYIALLAWIVGFASYPLLRSLIPAKLDRYDDISDRREITCPKQTPRTMVAVVFGQSNSSNHLGRRYSSERVVNYFNGRCFLAQDPLLGASGRAGSVWTLLGDKLLQSNRFDTVLLVPIGIGSSSVSRWAYGDLSVLLQTTLTNVRTSGYSVTHFLWHQGETDAGRLSANEYAAALNTVIHNARTQYPEAKFWVALASRCLVDAPDKAVRDGQSAVLGNNVFQGPDTDALFGSEYRFDGCHFSALGQERVAQEWLNVLR